MKIGLVLAGGGGKGAYELGVWKALRELNLTKYISVFSGTSIGAFNSVLFAMDEMEKAEKLWEEVTMEKLVPVSKTELIKRGIGLYIGGKNLQLAKKFLTDKLEHGAISNDGAVEMVEKYLDFDKIKENGRICYAACTKLPNLNTKYFRINDYDNETAKKIVLASASLPLIYDSTEIFGEKYIDGGIADNVPIQPVYGEGCDIIIVVLLSKDVQIDRSLYPNSSLIIISPENLSENTITGTLNLDTAAKRIRIIEGYNDTINKIDPIIKLIKFVNKKEEEIKNPTLYKTYKYLKDIKNKIEKTKINKKGKNKIR
ncbi:patatin-like phospholipase family protein [Clostridium sp.]|jgi:NTE family protein|uniref:patatin-like phospholipase family protein n=1 Tax=Clostridium sp. TaxID=1506 RepID=UPI0025BC27A7|nr:patatin-like phospholipase family protein [Clostridium sp.]MCI9070279.1 patatin-like phospholipase family protein [Clostridium sp.]MCI9303387.1 patatin-like phospholipase family protein [Clostridium sp.]